VPGGPLRHEREFARDFSTPQGALLLLDDAYRARDIDAAVAAKDFRCEAALMLSHLLPGARPDEEARVEILTGVATELEAGYRAHFTQAGFPDLAGAESHFSAAVPFKGNPDVVAVAEVIAYPDGGTSTQRMLVARTPDGWRGLVPAELYERPGGPSGRG